MNQRIEAWWNQQRASTARWRAWFQELESTGRFVKDERSDRIALLAVYVPILRAVALDFVHLWNTHRIRKQPNRPHTVPGLPHVLYHYPQAYGVEDFGPPVSQEAIDGFTALVDEQLGGSRIDEYLPQYTLDWC